MNLTGDILRVYQGFGVWGAGRGSGFWRLGRVRGNFYFCACFPDVWKLVVRTVHCVKFQTGHVLASVELEFAGIHAEIQVVGTSGLINAGGLLGFGWPL